MRHDRNTTTKVFFIENGTSCQEFGIFRAIPRHTNSQGTELESQILPQLGIFRFLDIPLPYKQLAVYLFFLEDEEWRLEIKFGEIVRNLNNAEVYKLLGFQKRQPLPTPPVKTSKKTKKTSSLRSQLQNLKVSQDVNDSQIQGGQENKPEAPPKSDTKSVKANKFIKRYKKTQRPAKL